MCILHLEYVQTQDEIGKLVINAQTNTSNDFLLDYTCIVIDYFL